MTSREFLRRVDYFSIFNDCSYLFNPSVLSSCYKATLYCVEPRRTVVRFCQHPTLSVFGDSDMMSCQSIYFELFTYNQFITELRFFTDFINRLSGGQFVSLVDKGSCSKLLSFLVLQHHSCLDRFSPDVINRI